MTKLQTAFCRVGEICLNGDILRLSLVNGNRSDVGMTLEEVIHKLIILEK